MISPKIIQISKTKILRNIRSTGWNSYFLHWNFDWKSCFVVFFLEWNEWKNPQFNFSSQNLSIERNFFKWDGKVTKISHLLFHRIWKITISTSMHVIYSNCLPFFAILKVTLIMAISWTVPFKSKFVLIKKRTCIKKNKIG